MTDPELKSVAAQVKKLTARVEALERLAKVRRNAKSGERMPRFFMSAFDWTTVGDVSSAIRASSSWGMEHDLS